MRNIQNVVSDWILYHVLQCIFICAPFIPLTVVPAFIVVFSLAPFYQNYIHVA